MRKYLVFMLTFTLLVLVLPMNVSHAATQAKGTPFEIDGELFVGPKDEPAPYINKDQRTMVPIRFFAEALGVLNDEEHIIWHQDLLTAEIRKDDTTVKVKLGDRIMKINHDREVTMDTVAEMRDSRIFIPARFIAEALDAKVYWDGDRQTVVILTKEYIDNHLAMRSGGIMDIDNPWLAEVFFEKHKARHAVIDFGSAEVLRKRISDTLQIAQQMQVIQDDENERFILVIPEHDSYEYRVRIGSPALSTEEIGTHYVYYKDANPNNGGLFRFNISDRRYGGIVYLIMGYKKGDVFKYGVGSPAENDFFGV